ncbi:MAG: hypothetical protein QGG54_10430, partial [Gammaproteobacteria bacterium]|nr:hypothetical protein [Gammaproteobacteria bacterium]
MKKNPALTALIAALTACLQCELLLAAEPDGAMTAVREYIEAEQRGRFDELMAVYGNNKELPTGFELQTLLALGHYPELKEVKIEFIV